MLSMCCTLGASVGHEPIVMRLFFKSIGFMDSMCEAISVTDPIHVGSSDIHLATIEHLV